MESIPNHFEFFNAEVVVDIPDQPAKRLKAVSLDIGKLNMQKTDLFTPIRAVANIVLEEEGAPGKYLTDLPRPVKISVRYSAADKQSAGDKPLVLAFWNGTGWVVFTKDKHNFKLTADPDPKKGGVGQVTITKWGDPPMVWGT